MAVLVVLIAVALLAAVVLLIVAPLRSSRQAGPADDAERQELEARREAKYREIRDAELDFRTGKLSSEDHAVIDAALRSEALDILNRLERRGDVSAAERSDPDETRPRGA